MIRKKSQSPSLENVTTKSAYEDYEYIELSLYGLTALTNHEWVTERAYQAQAQRLKGSRVRYTITIKNTQKEYNKTSPKRHKMTTKIPNDFKNMKMSTNNMS